MFSRRFFCALLSGAASFTCAAESTEDIRPWRTTPRFQRIARALDQVHAIDNHTHLLAPSKFSPALRTQMPLLLRFDNAQYLEVLRERLGLNWDRDRPVESDAEGRLLRAKRIEQAGGETPYWREHMEVSRTELALVNQSKPPAVNEQQFRWVPYASTFLTPLDPTQLGSRNPFSLRHYQSNAAQVAELLRAAGMNGVPETLDVYLAFVRQQLARWKEQGAVAIKFTEAYHRTLRFENVAQEDAQRLWTKGVSTALAREEYLKLQDHIARDIFYHAGELKLPVHIHSSHGAGPYLQLTESDVRHLESVLVDARFAKTHFVLIHGGAPWHEAAAYLASNKLNVWIDVSAMTFLYPVPDLASVLRIYLTFAPERTLFSTDTMSFSGTPVGAEFVHLALSRHLRESLYLCLSNLVRDGVLSEVEAVDLGRSFLAGNARSLYGFPPPAAAQP
jgi:predicted TIM-barrel fold metal-dependent hydrolase